MSHLIPNFNTKAELFKFLKTNKDTLIYAKKSEIKKADGVSFNAICNNDLINKINAVNKITSIRKSLINNIPQEEPEEALQILAVINTTNLLDSHGDVHINGIWDKSIAENKNVKHIQEHVMSFANIISDKQDLKVYTKNFTWSELGANYNGNTQALLFESTVKECRNEFMYDQYLSGNVDNHSVGMQYVKLFLCINNEDKFYKDEKTNWDKYIGVVANQQDAIDAGYFWAVTEAKLIEGSAVPIGSNPITPTLNNNLLNNKNIDNQAEQSLELLEAEQSLQVKAIDFNKIAKQKIFN